MSTPIQNTKAPRRSARKPRNHAPPGIAHIQGAVSENELSHAQIDGNNESRGARRKSHASPQKRLNGASGNASDSMPDKFKATPIKQQAYAGATFTNSPAASALPIPSFYSKSVPNVSHAPSHPTIHEQDSKESTPVPVQDDSPSKRESTPLDFLFNVARQAKGTPRGESPSANSSRLSVVANSPASRSPAPRDLESMFPFELDGASTPGEDGSSFATPYKERLDAMRSCRPTSSGVRDQLSEAERQEKSAALKQLLIKESTPSPPGNVELNNPFNARAPQPHVYFDTPNGQPRPRSNPSTPRYYTPNHPQSASNHHYSPAAPQFPQYTFHNGYRQTSNLRNHYDPASEPELAELSSDSAITPPRISTARKQSVPAVIPSPVASGHSQAGVRQTKPSLQQMEEQMRSFLKLDLTSKG